MTGGCRRACRTQKLVGFVQFGGQQQSVPWPSSTRRLVNDMTTCNKSSPPLSLSIQRNPEPILQGANGVFALRSITRRFFPSTHVAEREAQQCLMVCGQPEPVNSGGGWGVMYPITVIISLSIIIIVVVVHFYHNHIPLCLGDRFHSNRVWDEGGCESVCLCACVLQKNTDSLYPRSTNRCCTELQVGTTSFTIWLSENVCPCVLIHLDFGVIFV